MTKDGKPTRMTRDQLKGIVKELVTESANDAVDAAAASHKGQATNWMDQLRGDAPQAPAIRSKNHGKPPAFMGRTIQALAAGGGKGEEALKFAKAAWGSDDFVSKALGGATFVGGGALIVDEFAQSFIDRLRDVSVWRNLGARLIRPTTGTMTFPSLATSATAAYSEENAAIVVSEATFGQRLLQPKRLGCMSPVSNELLKWTDGGLDAMRLIEDDCLKAVSETENQVMIETGTGLLSQPKSLRNSVLAAHSTVATTASLATATTDLFIAMTALAEDNVPKPYVWVMSDRVWMYLQSVRNGNGVEGFATKLTASTGQNTGSPVGNLYGYDVFTTNAINDDFDGDATDFSTIYLVSPSEILFGEAPGVEIRVSDQGSYTEGGNLVSAFERNQSLVRVILHHDMILRHDESVAILTDVDWVSA